MNINNFDYKKVSFITGILLGISLIILALVFACKEARAPISQAEENAAITVTGEGEVTAIPDTANVSFTLSSTSMNVSEAQKNVSDQLTKILEEIKKLGVSDTDIKTTSYTTYPKYTYNQIYCITVPCPTPKQVLDGYEVSQTIALKLKNKDGVDLVGKTLGILGDEKITQISGPNFTIDDDAKLKQEARDIAIKDAKTKAKSLEKSLHIDLEKIIDYQENQNGYYPTMMKADFSTVSAQSVSIPTGENTVKVNVSITYSIR